MIANRCIETSVDILLKLIVVMVLPVLHGVSNAPR
jgi:hypothetical protein